MVGRLLLELWNKVAGCCACPESPHNVIEAFGCFPSVRALYPLLLRWQCLAISHMLILQVSEGMIRSPLEALYPENFDWAS